MCNKGVVGLKPTIYCSRTLIKNTLLSQILAQSSAVREAHPVNKLSYANIARIHHNYYYNGKLLVCSLPAYIYTAKESMPCIQKSITD